MTDTRLQLENRHTGETLRFRRIRDRGQVVLEIEGSLPPHSAGPPLHIHAMQHEEGAVLSGVLSGRVGGRTATFRAGEQLVFPAGVPHRWWNDGDEPLRFKGRAVPAADLDRVPGGGVCDRKRRNCWATFRLSHGAPAKSASPHPETRRHPGVAAADRSARRGRDWTRSGQVPALRMARRTRIVPRRAGRRSGTYVANSVREPNRFSPNVLRYGMDRRYRRERPIPVEQVIPVDQLRCTVRPARIATSKNKWITCAGDG
jgi:quercetin dioxygenase-like cupin family protein